MQALWKQSNTCLMTCRGHAAQRCCIHSPPQMFCPSAPPQGMSPSQQLGAHASCRYLQEQDEAAARQRFERQASRLHHLVSTSAIPSIYASPYAVLTGSIPRVEGVHLEEHIRTLSKSLVRRVLVIGW